MYSKQYFMGGVISFLISFCVLILISTKTISEAFIDNSNSNNIINRKNLVNSNILNKYKNNNDNKQSSFIKMKKINKRQQHQPLFANKFDSIDKVLIELSQKSIIAKELQPFFESLQTACINISNNVGLQGVKNAKKEEDDSSNNNQDHNKNQDEMNRADHMAKDLCLEAFDPIGKFTYLTTADDHSHPVVIGSICNGKYLAMINPLDGSSHLDSAINSGTIISIYKTPSTLTDNAWKWHTEKELRKIVREIKPSADLIASGYCLYSSSTMLMLSLGNGVNGFALDHQLGKFVVSNPNIVIPKRGKLYSINEANFPYWDQNLQNYILDIKQGKGASTNKYGYRYIGSLVGDVHRTLLKGGIFAYPSDTIHKHGKLHYLFEAAPMSFLIEQAGGKSISIRSSSMSNNNNNNESTKKYGDLLQTKLTSFSQRIPVYLGSTEDVIELETCLIKK